MKSRFLAAWACIKGESVVFNIIELEAMQGWLHLTVKKNLNVIDVNSISTSLNVSTPESQDKGTFYSYNDLKDKDGNINCELTSEGKVK